MLKLCFSHSCLLHWMIGLQSQCRANRLSLPPTPFSRKMQCQQSWQDCGQHGLSNDVLLEFDPDDRAKWVACNVSCWTKSHILAQRASRQLANYGSVWIWTKVVLTKKKIGTPMKSSCFMVQRQSFGWLPFPPAPPWLKCILANSWVSPGRPISSPNNW
jgi:hypothetical protein